MTICFVSDSYPNVSYGGIAIYTQRLARALARRGNSVHVIAKSTRDADLDDQGVHVHFRRVRWLPVAGKWLPGLGESIGIARALLKLHRQYQFDLVEFPNWEGLGLAGTTMLPIPCVMRLHTSVTESVEIAGRPPTGGERFMMWAEKTSARQATAVLTHSEAHRRRMAVVYDLQEIELIPHGVLIPELAAPTPDKNVLCIGRMDSRKAMHIFIEAIPAVLEKAPGATFTVVGADENHAGVREFRAQFPGIAAAQFFGTVSEAELDELYNRCAIYASPSVYESFGLTLVEAMAHGRPVVGFATSAMPEIIQHGMTGLLVEPGNKAAFAEAIVTLLQDDALRLRMGAEARRVAADQYGIDEIAGRVEQYFRAIQNEL